MVIDPSLLDRLASSVTVHEPAAPPRQRMVDARTFLSVPKPGTDLLGTTRELYGWHPAAHHLIWAQALTKLAKREIPNNRLLIVAPPGHAKTNWAGIAFPTWYIAQHQYDHVLSFSATGNLSRKSSTTVRDTIANSRGWRDMYPNVVPDFDKGWSQNAWFVKRPLAPGDKDPTMFSTSVGSQSVLGGRGDLLLFDDVSTQENTKIQNRRDLVKDWIGQTAFSRATPGALMLAIMTRWHADDIAAYFEREGFTIIVMPANGYWESPDDYLAADINGGALWPAHINEEMLLSSRSGMGDFKYTAMYQGNPVAVEGAVFKEEFFGPWFLPMESPVARVELLAKKRAIVAPFDAVVINDSDGRPEVMPLGYKAMFVDTALKAGQDNDFTEFAVWGVGLNKQAYLLAEYHAQVDAADLFEKFIEFWREQRCDIAVIEDKGSGIQLLQDVQRKTSVPVAAITPSASKEDRARGQVHVVKGAFHIPNPDTAGILGQEWVADFLKEHLEFPRGSHDDRVDTTSMAAEFLKYMLDFFMRDSDDVFNGLGEQPEFESGLRGRMDAHGGPEFIGSDDINDNNGERGSIFGEAASMGVW